MVKKDINAPIEGDDIGNLLKAGYAANELPLAKKIYAQELKEHAEQMAATTFSDFLFEQAAVNYIVTQELAK